MCLAAVPDNKAVFVTQMFYDIIRFHRDVEHVEALEIQLPSNFNWFLRWLVIKFYESDQKQSNRKHNLTLI